jgi:NADH-quinone oxidoreductase subunit H
MSSVSRPMNLASRLWNSLTLVERIGLVAIVVLMALGGLLTLAVLLLLQPTIDWLNANLPLVRFVVAVLGILLLTVPTAFVVIYLELKVIARMNLRVGPNRIGPLGAVMSVTTGLKVLMKEDYTPTGVDKQLFTLAPVITFLASVMTLLVIPFAPGIFGQDLNIGLLYFFAVGGLGVLGLLMAGWSSFNKYSLLGGMRSAAQIVSYEIPLTLSVVGVVLLANTLSLNQLVAAQSGSALDWFAFKQPLALLIFFIAATAEANRTPFDMTEADSEIVAGFATEYSGMRFGFFFFAEYVNVFIMSALLVTLFFGGWTAPFDWPWPYDLNWLHLERLGWFWLLTIPGLLLLASEILAILVKIVGGREWGFWDSLVMGFLIAGALGTALLGLAAFIAFDWVQGIFWLMAKTYVFVFTFIWMRATLPRVRIDQLMGFAWKWLLPASLLNVLVTATAVILLNR